MNRFLLAALAMLLGCGCGNKVSAPITTPPASTTRTYNGTASVGDFLNITIDGTAHTLHYFNRSNGDSGTVPYTIGTDGTYTLADPGGNLISAYEVPNFVLLIQAAKTGPDHNVASLVMAVQSSPISVATISTHRYNYMQFRTSSGGVEIGSALIDGAGLVGISRYWPYGSQGGSDAFHTGQVSSSAFEADPSGLFLRLPDGVGMYDYMFGTPNGVWAVDTPSGAIMGFEQAVSKNFVAGNAGTYKAIFYQKTNATTGVGNVESGTGVLGSGTVLVGAGGSITISNDGGVLATGTLVPVADATHLYGVDGQLADPCNGLFTLRLTTETTQQDVFVTFLGQAVMFSSYKTALPLNGGNAYDYFYGAALK